MSFRSPKRSSQVAQLEGGLCSQNSSRKNVNSLQPLEEMVTCSIDFNFFEDPRLLPCGHVFCCQCLNSYLKRLPPPQPNPIAEVKKSKPKFMLPCPICRAKCTVPESGNAEGFPKAFNHTLILEYIRKQNISQWAEQNDDPASIGCRLSSETNPSPHGRRKNSIQVKSDMLKHLVGDILCKQATGNNSPLDRAVIIDEVNKLLQQLQVPDKRMSIGEPIYVTPTAPPLPVISAVKRDSHQRASSTDKVNGSGRFQAAVDQIRAATTPPMSPSFTGDATTTSSETPNEDNYTMYRDVEFKYDEMKHNAKYVRLFKTKLHCDPSSPNRQAVDMSVIRGADEGLIQYTATCDNQSEMINVWRKRVILPGQSRRSKYLSSGLARNSVTHVSGAVKLEDMGRLHVQHLRFFKNRIYLTGIIKQNSTEATRNGASTHSSTLPSLFEPGIVVCCALPWDDTDPAGSTHQSCTGSTSLSPQDFTVLAISKVFYRDSVGCEHLDRPSIAGLDIDKTTGEVYVALCANAMICRLNPEDLTQVDRQWYINEPQLSPSYVCLAKKEEQVWASCPLDDKIFILDLVKDTFVHFTPSTHFDIEPSHIICNTLGHVVLLDNKKSRLFWIAAVHQTTCIQRLDLGFMSQNKRKFTSIQSVADTDIGSKQERSRKRLFGGIMCGGTNRAFLIYPKKNSKEYALPFETCFGRG